MNQSFNQLTNQSLRARFTPSPNLLITRRLVVEVLGPIGPRIFVEILMGPFPARPNYYYHKPCRYVTKEVGCAPHRAGLGQARAVCTTIERESGGGNPQTLCTCARLQSRSPPSAVLGVKRLLDVIHPAAAWCAVGGGCQ